MRWIAALGTVVLFACGGDSDADLAPVAVFVGDSNTQLWQLNAINAGISGLKTEDMLARLDRDVLSHEPTLVHILAGTNDIFTDQPTTTHLVTMSNRVAAAGATVIIGTIPPISDTPETTGKVLAWNAELRSIASSHGYRLADYYPALVNEDGSPNSALFADPIHVNAAGYARMCDVLRAVTPEIRNPFCSA
jgi:lysophospholipase L1-like esterase